MKNVYCFSYIVRVTWPGLVGVIYILKFIFINYAVDHETQNANKIVKTIILHSLFRMCGHSFNVKH